MFINRIVFISVLFLWVLCGLVLFFPISVYAQQPPPPLPLQTPNEDLSLTDAQGGLPNFPPADQDANATALSPEDENLFFDADALVPEGEMGRKGGPRKVNPRLEPGSKLIVVRKAGDGSSRDSQLIFAERAIKLGRYESALEIYERLYDNNKHDPNILLGRAISYQKTGRTDSAIRAYEELLTKSPNNVEAQINMLGLMGERYPAVSLRRLLVLREKNPHHVGIVAQIAVMEAALGAHDEALQYLGVAAGMEPNNPAHLYNMAVIADRAGTAKEAIRYYEQALEIDTIYTGGRAIPREAVFERLAQLR